MFVRWPETRGALLLSDIPKQDKRVKDAPLAVGDTIKIVPWVSWIENDLWERIKGQLKDHIDDDVLIVYCGDKGEPKEIGDLEPNLAAQLIRDCWQIDSLEHMQQSTVDKELSLAINNQITELENFVRTGKKKEKSPRRR